MAENKTAKTGNVDYVLKQNANLADLSRDVKAGLAKMLPGIVLTERLEGDDWKLDSTHRDYQFVLSDMQSLRQKDTKYVPKNTTLTIIDKDEKYGVEFQLDNSEIDGDVPEGKVQKFYKMIKPYLIPKIKIKDSVKEELAKNG